jgi:lipoprotein-anchoring transpeptidase ErfK/SrfK
MTAVAAAEVPPVGEVQAPPAPIGRITTWWRQAVRKEPAPNAEPVAWTSRDHLLPLHGALQGEPPWPTNPVWYQTEGGYIHSGYVQPVADTPQPEVINPVPEPGFWAQVCVPWAEARWSPTSAYTAFKLYYGTVYRVVATEIDEEGQAWYRLKEGVSTWSPGPYVPASSVRRITAGQLTPINPDAPDKWIKIDVGAQTLTCLQGDTVVFSDRTATGLWGTATPLGEFRVLYKRHTRRMIGGAPGDRYDLPGVAFPVYFTWSGVAIHGTYWHNDYGRRHSHGCVNLTHQSAEWVFRWVNPVAPYEVYTQDAEPREAGTRVVVVSS